MIVVTIFLCLAGMIYQDWKYRKVHILWLVVLFFGSIYLLYNNYNNILSIIIYNCLFFLFVFGGLIAYLSIKKGKYINPFKEHFGLGDLLFYLAISPLFMLQSYILFFVVSMLFSIVLAYIFKKQYQRGIPLAGNSSILLTFSIGVDLLFYNLSITLIG